MMSDDPFHILGLSADAARDEIRRAYRRLAMRWHPDRNPHSRESEEHFKRIKAAHDLALDPAAYDAWKSAQRPPPPAAAAPIEQTLEIPLDVSVHGGPCPVTVTQTVRCTPCAGRGRIEQAHSVPCPRCGGVGRLRSPSRTASEHCTECTGRGYVRHVPCPNCSGDGHRESRRTYTVEVPPGRRAGDTLRLAPGGQHILLRITLAAHPLFTTAGDDLHARMPIDCFTRMAGGRVEVPTLEGPKTVDLPELNADAAIRIPGAGLPRSDGGRGTLVLILDILFPTRLSAGDARTLRRMGAALQQSGQLPPAWHDWQRELQRGQTAPAGCVKAD